MRNPYEHFEEFRRDLLSAARGTAIAPLREQAAILDGGHERRLSNSVTVIRADDFPDKEKARSSPVSDRPFSYGTLHYLVCERLHALMQRAGWQLPEGADPDRQFEVVAEVATDLMNDQGKQCIECGKLLADFGNQNRLCVACRNVRR